MFLELDEQNRDLGVLSLEGSPEPLLATEFNERNAEISPDGRWMAYKALVGLFPPRRVAAASGPPPGCAILHVNGEG